MSLYPSYKEEIEKPLLSAKATGNQTADIDGLHQRLLDQLQRIRGTTERLNEVANALYGETPESDSTSNTPSTLPNLFFGGALGSLESTIQDLKHATTRLACVADRLSHLA